ncbi:MAG: hypothetical protein ACR2NU_07320 [Aeoliella sp.]
MNRRFFRSVGQAMILADEQLNGGANRLAIQNGFAAHNIALDSAGALAPTAALAGTFSKLTARTKSVRLSATTRKDLLNRIGAKPGAKLRTSILTMAGQRVGQAVYEREVSLSKLDKRLRGVVCQISEPLLVGEAEGRATLLGDLPEANATSDEATSFVESLLKEDCIDFGGRKKATAAAAAEKPLRTHRIRTIRGKKVLTRVGYACQHGN